MTDGHRIITNANDWMRSIERRISAIERRPAVMSRQQILGQAIAPGAVQVVDWNAESILLNGWYWSEAPAANAPTLVNDWIGSAVVAVPPDGLVKGIQILYQLDSPLVEYRRSFEIGVGEIASFDPWALVT